MNTLPEALPGRWSRLWTTAAPTLSRYRYPLAIYAASRLVYMLIAVVDSVAQHKSITGLLSNWDGYWYDQTTLHWYFHHVFTGRHQYTTLGFLPLFPALQWLVMHVTQLSVAWSGILLSLAFGASATILVMELAQHWWGESAARRTLWFWCFFPGTVVFSMVYTEGLLITLVAGAMLLLARKRWAPAGLLAGLATAVAPVAVAMIPACAAAALLEIRKRGWHDRKARRSLVAPLLSPLGLVGFGIFLWFWCGTPLASYKAQHGAWEESSTPLAIPRTFGSLIHQIFISGVGNHGPGGIDLNGIAALVGTLFLLYGLWRMWKVRRTIPLPVWTFTVIAALLALTSAKTPPNPRLLICTFPVVLVVGARFTGRARWWALAADVALMLVMTWFTYVGIWLRP